MPLRVGRGLLTKRSRSWQADSTAVHERFDAFTEQCRTLAAGRQWKKLCRLQEASLELILSRLRVGKEASSQSRWSRLCAQWRTNDIETMATGIRENLTTSPSSCIYHLFSFNSAWTYVGLVQSRPSSQRAEEHFAALGDKYTEEWKYKKMRSMAPASSWVFLPIVCCSGSLPLGQLERIETEEIGVVKHCINTARSRAKKVRPSSVSKTTPKSSAGQTNRVVRLEGYTVGDGPPVLECDINRLFMSDTFVVHASRVKNHVPTTLSRRFRRSDMHVYAVEDRRISFEGSLRATLQWMRRAPSVWLICKFLRRRESRPSRSELYQKLATRSTREMKDMCEGLSAESLFRLWWISRREAPPAVQPRNRAEIERAIRRKGFMCLPEKRLVLKIPPDGRASRKEINTAVRGMLRRSWVHPSIANGVMWTVQIVYSAATTIGRRLDTTKWWIRTISEAEPLCQCHRYPSSWPRRHGHICLPSWEYVGPWASLMRSKMHREARQRYRPSALRHALITFWLKYLPSELLPSRIMVPEGPQSGDFDDDVSLLARYLRFLVVMGVDKCRNRLVAVCPVLFWSWYCSTFPVELDTVHFEDVPMTEFDYGRWLKTVYDERGWKSIATWHSGSAPRPYNLIKLKDLIRPCAAVFAEKGKCCRQRPISPNTDHWLRRVYRRVGAVLRLLVLSMPPESITFMSSQDLLGFIVEWNKHEGQWLRYTGDIGNCYDELDHNRCLDGVRWGLDSLPGWLGRRQVRCFTVDKFNRKDCRPGTSESYERVNITESQVFGVCEFDCKNAVVMVHGKLRRRRLGAPMGGFLSAFYAILCFAFIEHRLVMPAFIRLGVPGGIRRYLDDILAVFCTNMKRSVVDVGEFMLWLASPLVYPPPLVLNLEPEGDQDFLESRVLLDDDGQLELQLHNEVVADYIARRAPYRRRLCGPPDVSSRVTFSLVANIALRALQYCSSGPRLAESLLQLKLECIASGVCLGAFNRAVNMLRSKYNDHETVRFVVNSKSI